MTIAEAEQPVPADQENEPRPVERIRWPTLFLYGLPSLPLAALTLPVYIYVPTLYASILPPAQLGMIGLVLMLARIVDAVSDPVIGAASDATKSRFGRRKPWLFVATPLTMIAFYAIMTPAPDTHIGYLALWSVALTLCWTLALLPYNSWGAELSDDYHERTRISAVREGVTVAGTLLAAGLPAALAAFGIAALGDQLHWLAVGVCILLPPAVALALWHVPDKAHRAVQSWTFRSAGAHIRRNGPFWRFIASHFINATANGFPATLFLLFVTYRLEMPEAQGGLLFLYFLAGLAGIPFWTWLSRRISKHRAWGYAMLLACASFVWTPFVVGPGDIAVFVVISLVSGFAVGADLALPASIQADVVDADRAKSGARNTGIYFAAWGIATKAALGISVGVAFLALGAVGFDANTPPVDAANSETALMMLGLLYAFVPVILKLAAIAIMWRFPLDEKLQRDLTSSAAGRAE